MKKNLDRNIMLLVSAILCVVGVYMLVSDSDGGEYKFSDAGIEKLTRMALNRETGAISKADIIKIKRLPAADDLALPEDAGETEDCVYAFYAANEINIKSLEDLSEFAALEELYLRAGPLEFTDLAELNDSTFQSYVDMLRRFANTNDAPSSSLLDFIFRRDATPVQPQQETEEATLGELMVNYAQRNGKDVESVERDFIARYGEPEYSEGYLSHIFISDLSPLKGLANLKTLCIYNLNVETPALAELAHLKTLRLSGMGDNVAHASKIVDLTELSLRCDKIADLNWLSPISGLAKVEKLSLSGARGADLSGIAGMKSVSTLTLSVDGLSDVSALAGMTGISELNIKSDAVNDIKVLDALQSLTEFSLDLPALNDASVLRGLSNVTRLSLSNVNAAADADGKGLAYQIGGMRGLVGLTIHNCKMGDIGGIAELSSLETLSITDCSLSDISPLSALTGIKSLDLSGNEISDASPLSALTALEIANLSGNKIELASSFANLANVKTLDLSDNMIVYATALSSLKKLERLSLANNPIADASPLAQITSLKSVDLRGCSALDEESVSALKCEVLIDEKPETVATEAEADS